VLLKGKAAPNQLSYKVGRKEEKSRSLLANR